MPNNTTDLYIFLLTFLMEPHKPTSTEISEESPDFYKIPCVGVRPPIARERRRFPDTIDLNPQPPCDPNFDDSAVSCDAPTYMQTNEFISIRPPKPSWQVRMSQELLWKDATGGGLNTHQVQALKEQFGLVWKLKPKDYPEIETHVEEGAAHRGKRHSTERERIMLKQKRSSIKKQRAKHANTVNNMTATINYFNNTIGYKPDPGITQIDGEAVRKPIGAPCSLFL